MEEQKEDKIKNAQIKINRLDKDIKIIDLYYC